MARAIGPPAHVGNRTTAQSTRSGQTAMYAHVTTTLLQVVAGDPLDLCFRANGFTEFVDLLGLTETDIEGLVYDDPGPPVRKKIPVPRGYTQRLKILIALYLNWLHK